MNQRFEPLEELSHEGPVKLSRVRDAESGRELWLRRYDIEEADAVALSAVLDTVIQARNPNLERILEAGKDAEGWFALIEDMPGVPLSELLQGGPLTVPEFDQLVHQTLKALNVLHEKGLPHLALRPEVIRVVKTPDKPLEVRVGGIGEGQADRSLRADADPARYRCAAPEFWCNEAVGRRTDVYALGCVYYEALAARPAFSARTIDRMSAAHAQSEVTPLGAVALQVQPWVVAWVTSLLTASSDDRLRNAKAVRKLYEMGIHGLQAAKAPSPQPAMTGTHPYAMPPYGYLPQHGLPVPYTQQAPAHTTAQHLVITQPQAPKPTPLSAPGVPQAPASSASPAAAQYPITKIPPLYWGAGAAGLFVLVLLIIGFAGSKPKPAAQPATPAAATVANSPTTTTTPVVSPAATTPDGPVYDNISDAQPSHITPHPERPGVVPFSNSLAYFFTSGDNVQTYKDPDSPQDVGASPEDTVFFWRDKTAVGGPCNMGGDRRKPLELPKLHVVRIPPANRDFPVVSFHRSQMISARCAEGATGYPFDPALPKAAITVFQALRCRPVTGITCRTLRVGCVNGNTNVLSIQVDDRGTFRATLGPKNKTVPPVAGFGSQFCIVSCLWDADGGTAQLFSRAADGATHEGASTTNLPEERDPGDRVQIGDTSATLTTSGYKFNGDVLDTLIYNRALATEERIRVESWLADYYFGKP